MGIAKIASDLPPSVKGAIVEKKVAKTTLASLYTPPPPLPLMGNAHVETTHLKKGLPLTAATNMITIFSRLLAT